MRIDKSLVICVLVYMSLAVNACMLDVEQPGHEFINDPTYVQITVHDCYDIPYWQDPEWCDLYNSGECCTWHIDGWYEEWCDWGYTGCWEHTGSY